MKSFLNKGWNISLTEKILVTTNIILYSYLAYSIKYDYYIYYDLIKKE